MDPCPTATITYSGSPYCSTAGTANVTLTGTGGGSYTSTAGLSIDGSTGAVDLGASTAGAYTVNYTIPASGGCAEYTTTSTITITAAPSASFSYAGSPYCSNAGTVSPSFSGTTGGTFSSTAGLSITGSNGAVNTSTSTPGTYTVVYSVGPAGGCGSYTTTADITIEQAPSANISYAGPFCSNQGPTPVWMTGTLGGIYSASPAGLSLNPTTGWITPGGSTPGTYTVTYTIAATAACAEFTTTASVTITAQPNATMSYSGSPYCNAGGTAAVSFSGTTGGTFSSQGGLVINGSTGEVDLNASTPNNSFFYTVFYDVAAAGGCGTFNTTASITINATPVWYQDQDNDGFGDPASTLTACNQPVGYVGNNTDNCPAVTNADQLNTDGDALGDACDGCPTDANKTAAGVCGCGVPDTDGDNDGTADCIDGCPADPDKIAPGACGCGVADVPVTWYADADGDGFGNAAAPLNGFTCQPLPAGYVTNNSDCNDAMVYYTDADGDLFGTLPKLACGTVTNNSDCNDTSANLTVPGNACNDGNGQTINDVVTNVCTCVGQLLGCTDPLGQNHNPLAVVNDGSCTYCSATVATNTPIATPIMIGSGIPVNNASVGTDCHGFEVGLAAFRRYLGAVVPAGNVYTVEAGNSPTSPSDPTPADGLARWNYLLSVNLGTSTFNQVKVWFDIDLDPGVGTTYAPMDISAYMISQSLGATSLFQDSQNRGFAFWTQAPFNFPAFNPYQAGTYDLRVRLESATTNTPLMTVPIQVVVTPVMQVDATVLLDGPYNEASHRMNDDLRTANLIPSVQPYTAAPFSYSGSETVSPAVLSVTGDNAIVDWVLVELRSSSTPATILHRRAALVQRDGDVVGTDGVEPVRFTGVPDGSYHVALRHRNHLGAMTATALSIQASSSNPVDLTTAATWGTDAQKLRDGRLMLWGGNAGVNDRLRYTGTSNDRDPILIAVGGFVPTATLPNVYRTEDTGMDGTVKYTNAGNDRELILQNINWGLPGISVTRQRLQQLP